MLPSLRQLIADGMRGLARTQARDLPELARLSRGADTLEWCDERDLVPRFVGNPYADPIRIEQLEEDLDAIQGALDDWIASKLAKPAEFRDRLLRLLSN